MANDVTRSPMSLDTAGVIFAGDIRIRIKSIRWVSLLATAGDEVILHDGDGRVVWHSVANAADYVERDVIMNLLNGLTVDTIDSGVLYIEV